MITCFVTVSVWTLLVILHLQQVCDDRPYKPTRLHRAWCPIAWEKWWKTSEFFLDRKKKSSAWKCQEVCRQGGVGGRPERGWNNICGHHYCKSAHGQRNYHLLEEGEHLAKNRLVLLLAWLCLRDITLTNMHLCIYATHISNRLIPFLPPGSPKVVVRKR